MNSSHMLRLVVLCALFLPIVSGFAQEDVEFKRELFQRAKVLAQSIDDFGDWHEFEEADIILAPAEHPRPERLREIREATHRHEMAKIEAVSDYLISCAKCGVIERSITPLHSMKLSEEVLYATLDMSRCCGFYDDQVSFAKLYDFVSSCIGKPYMAYAEVGLGIVSEDDAKAKVVARKVSPKMVKQLQTEMRCLFHLGQAEAGKLKEEWHEHVRDDLFKDFVRLQQVIKMSDENDFTAAMDMLSEFENRPILDRANWEVFVRVRYFQESKSNKAEIAKVIFEIFRSSDFADGIFDEEGVWDFVFEMGSDDYYGRVAEFTDEMLDHNLDVAISAKEILNFAVETGLTIDGLDQVSNFDHRESKLCWLKAMYSRSRKLGDHRTMAAAMDEVPVEEREAFIQGPLERHWVILTLTASEVGDFGDAEKYLSQISLEKHQSRGSLIVAAYRNNEADQKVLAKTMAAKKFLTKLESVSQKQMERMKWIVSYTMKTGWVEWNKSHSLEPVPGDMLIFARNQIQGEFSKVAEVEGARQWLLHNLNSFTPPSDQSRVILEGMLKLCGGGPESSYAQGKKKTVDEVFEKVRLLSENSVISVTEKSRAENELLEMSIEQLEKRDLSKESFRLHQFALEFAKLGHKPAVNKLISMISDDEDKAMALLDCAMAFPPVSETMLETEKGPRTLGGGGVF